MMTAAQIIKELERLPPAEWEKVANFMRQGHPVAPGVSADVAQAAERIFERQADLFRKLAL